MGLLLKLYLFPVWHFRPFLDVSLLSKSQYISAYGCILNVMLQVEGFDVMFLEEIDEQEQQQKEAREEGEGRERESSEIYSHIFAIAGFWYL